MAHVPGNQWTLAVGKQTAKGTPQTTPTYKLKVTGGDMNPQVDQIQLNETDATSQAASTVKVGFHAEGAPEVYLRPADAGFLLYWALGAISTSGTTDFTHVITPATSGPYATLYKAIGSTVVVDRYADVRPTSISIRGSSGQALTAGLNLYGLSYLLGSADPVLTPVADVPYVWPEVTVMKGGSDPGTIESFDLTINRNGVPMPGDVGYAMRDYVWGKFDVSGTFTQMFENDTDYRRFYGGSAAATTPTTTVFTEALSFIITRSATVKITLAMTGVSYTAYPVAPDPGGAPIRVAVGFRTEPQTTLAANLTCTVLNSVASY